MRTRAEPKHTFPMRFGLKGRSILLRPLADGDREAMVTFARGLPRDDLLFLQRDITQSAEVDAWISEAMAGSLVTLVAWEGKDAVGYATFRRGSAPWMRHVAELRVVVAQSARGIGIGHLLLELAFEMVLSLGVTKVVARMTPDQTGAQRLFKNVGFAEEAVLRDHALGADGLTHDLLMLTYHTKLHQDDRCESCGIPVLNALSLDGSRLCSHCYEVRYSELGGGS